ncbi:hypothetical protein KY284_015093 [Solanum tuberosum]|nr:hypothetical protein KY284_015093 [Solanum tuberosum]
MSLTDCGFLGLEPFLISLRVDVDPLWLGAYLRSSTESICPRAILLVGRLAPLGVGWLPRWKPLGVGWLVERLTPLGVGWLARRRGYLRSSTELTQP